MGGAQSLPPARRQLAQCMIEEGVPIQSIIEEVRCSERTIFNYKRNLKDHGSCLAPSISRMGRPPILADAMIEVQSVCGLKSAAIPHVFKFRLKIGRI